MDAVQSIREGHSSSLRVRVGATVRVAMPDGSERMFRIGTPKETDPNSGILSDECPIGKALMGKTAGDTATYRVREKTFTVRVLEVR